MSNTIMDRHISPPRTKHNTPRLICFIAVMLVAAGVYLPSLTAAFVYDDEAQVLNDTYIHNPANFINVLTLNVLRQDVLDNNRPVHLLSMMVDAAMWGKKPLGYHLTNILLHAVNTGLLLGVLLQLLGRLSVEKKAALSAATAGALIFAVHPAASEAVAPVTFREDLLIATFSLLCLLCAGRFETALGRVKIAWGAVTVLCCFLAVGAKESGVAASAMLLAYWLIFRKKYAVPQPRWAWPLLMAAAFAAAAAFLAARFALVPKQSEVFVEKPQYLGGSFGSMLQIQPCIWWFQIVEVFAGVGFCADHTFWTVISVNLPVALLGLSVIVLLVLWGRKDRLVLFAAVTWAATIGPVSNIVPMYRPMADRYLYLPLVAAAILAASLAARVVVWRKGTLKMAGAVVIAALLTVLAYQSFQRQRVWHDSLSLWDATFRENPHSQTASSNLATAQYRAGLKEQAVRSWELAVRVSRESSPEAWGSLAMGLEAVGRHDEADEALLRAAAIAPRYGEPAKLVGQLSWPADEAAVLEKIVARIRPRLQAQTMPATVPATPASGN